MTTKQDNTRKLFYQQAHPAFISSLIKTDSLSIACATPSSP
jgi:hypothetical protein